MVVENDALKSFKSDGSLAVQRKKTKYSQKTKLN